MSRSRNSRIPRSAVAIVGEGDTEWHYFTSMKQTERFPFKVSPELPKHSSIDAIIKRAHSLVNEGYSKVFCVLDLDIHCSNNQKFQDYQAKKSRAIKKSKNKIVFIESMPCIEIWFFLHFCSFSTKEYANYDELKPDLKKYLPDYDKSSKFFTSKNFYERLLEQGSIENALELAEKLLEYYQMEESITLPRCKIFELYEYLKSKC